MIRVLRIDHVALHITDTEKTADFYTGLLGLKRVAFPLSDNDRERQRVRAWQASVGVPVPEGGLWVQVADSQLHLINSPETPARLNPFGPHLALEVESLEDAKRTLEAQGLKYLTGPDGMPFRQIWISDPNGNTIELWQRV